MATSAKQRFNALAAVMDKEAALFCMCAVLDREYNPEIAQETANWTEYEAVPKGAFADGVTDYALLLDGKTPTEERWEKVWGNGDAENPYVEKDYRRLDELYKTMTAQLDAVGGLDRQQEDTARFCCHMALQREKLIASRKKDNISMASTLDKMIRENLADCNMRKKDMTVTQAQRPDGIVDALNKQYGIGADMTKDEFFEVFHQWLGTKKYPHTVDAAEHEMLAILRTMQKNNGDPESVDLPKDMALGEYAQEFSDTPNDAENEAYAYLQIARGTAAERNEE